MNLFILSTWQDLHLKNYVPHVPLCWKKKWNPLDGNTGNRLSTFDSLRSVHYFRLAVLMFERLCVSGSWLWAFYMFLAISFLVIVWCDMVLYAYLIKISCVRTEFCFLISFCKRLYIFLPLKLIPIKLCRVIKYLSIQQCYFIKIKLI